MLTSKFSLTLVLYTTLALILTPTHATVDVNRRHSNLNRMIKKRSPFYERADTLLPIIGAGADPATASTDPNAAPSTAGQPTSTVNPVHGPLTTPGISGSALSTGSASSSSGISSTSSTSSSVVQSASIAPPPETFSFAPSSTIQDPGISSVFITSTAAVASSSSTSAASSGAVKHTTVTVLIVIAASIGGVALLWTIIRKWKFRPSSQFEDRMQPIDWQPTISPEEGMAAHRRNLSGTSSFHSGFDHGAENAAARGLGAGYGETDPAANVVPGVPEHDFTAGPAHLAPIGGYADLARGSSPQPPMQEVLARGPSMHRMQYDHQHGVPTHQHGYSQEAYDYNGKATY